MHVALSTSLAAMMLVHSLLGCCWHHAHEADDVSPATATVTIGCSHGDHDHSEHPSSNVPCKHPDKGACPGGCVYVSSARPQLSKVLMLASLDCVVALPALDHADNQLDCWERTAFSPALGPPVRLHLLHQILLI